MHGILCGHHPAATSRVQRNSVASTHIRCMITASRRASARYHRTAICVRALEIRLAEGAHHAIFGGRADIDGQRHAQA